MKQGQITVYVILGLALLFLVIGAYSLLKFTSKIEINRPVEKAVELTHVQSCLRFGVHDAIENLSLQGGMWYASQGGTDANPEDTNKWVVFSDRSISYTVGMGLIANPLSYDNETYPQRDSPDETLASKLIFDENVVQAAAAFSWYGLVTLPAFCQKDGTNSRLDPASSSSYLPCSTYAETDTIEQKLVALTKIRFNDCMQSQYKYSKFSDALVTYRFGSEQIGVTLANVIPKNETTAVFPIRLKRVYDAMRAVLTEDSRNISFSKKGDGLSLQSCDSSLCFVPGMSIGHMSEGISHSRLMNAASIVVIEDQQSLVNGRPLRFVAGVENRRPVLDYVYNQLTDLSYDIIATTDDQITLVAPFYDPDEEDQLGLTLTYTDSSGNSISMPYAVPQGNSKITVTVADTHGQKDWQVVKIKGNDP